MGKPAPNSRFSVAHDGNTGPSLPPRSRRTAPPPHRGKAGPNLGLGRPRAHVNRTGSTPLARVHAVALRPHHHSTALCAVTKPFRTAVSGFYGLQRSAVGLATTNASRGPTGGLRHSHTRRAFLWPPLGGRHVNLAAGGGFRVGWGSGFLAKPKRGGACASTDGSEYAQRSHRVVTRLDSGGFLHKVASL
jgi:hypothetical protein